MTVSLADLVAELRSSPQDFWRLVVVGEPDACWTFRSGRVASFRGHPAACVALALSRDFDHSLHVCHRCDNRPCVNPAHLFPGTLNRRGPFHELGDAPKALVCSRYVDVGFRRRQFEGGMLTRFLPDDVEAA